MFQENLLKGRAIFLTGGGTGLGRSMALRFAELGARMFLVGRREEPLRETCEEIHRAGGAAAFTTCDVRDYGAVEAAAAKAEEQFGEINALVNNAAGNFMARTEKLTPNAFNAVVGIVLNGTFHCTQVFGKRWISRKLGGNVLNIVTTCAVGLRQGWCTRNDDLAGGRMGQISHPAERHRAGTLSDGRRLVALDAVKAVRGTHQG